MILLKACSMLILGYLSGSVNYAILVTLLVAGRDIRTLGNLNPGTANVGRSIGKGWAVLVFFLDVFKGLGPMLVARLLFFPQGPVWHFFLLAAIGLAAVVGHCRPVFFHFHGGRGIATAIGVYSFFVPGELLLSMLLGFLIVIVFLRRVRFRVGRWTPILFVTLTPFMTLAFSLFIDLPLFAGLTLGGHPRHVVLVVFLLSFAILAINLRFMGRRLQEIGGRRVEED